MNTEAVRALLVEDDVDVATGLGEFLSAHGIECDFAGNAVEAMHVMTQARFDLLILDINLPGEDGISLCRRLKSAGGAVTALFLTADGGLDSKLSAFAAGGVDYVVKPFAPEELLARVRALAGRRHGASARARVVGPYRLDREGHLLSRDGLHLPLGEFGTRLLDCLMQAWPASIAAEALADTLWGDRVPPSNPLRSHVHQLRRALLQCFGQPLIESRRGVGYRFAPERE